MSITVKSASTAPSRCSEAPNFRSPPVIDRSYILWILELQISACRLWLEKTPPRLGEAMKTLRSISEIAGARGLRHIAAVSTIDQVITDEVSDVAWIVRKLEETEQSCRSPLE